MLRSLAVVLALAAGVSGCATSGAGEQPRSAPAATPTATATAPAPAPEGLSEEPRHPRGPADTTRMIVAAERAITDPTTSPADLAVAGQVQQLAYRTLGAHPSWDRRVRAALPAGLRRVAADNVASRRAFRSMHGRLADTLPAWRIVEPAPAEELMAAYREAQRRTGVDWEYLAAINLVETAMGRIRGTSVAGAQGPMQFMPATWGEWGRGDINDPRDAILAAGRYLAHHGFNRRGGIAGALFRYNNSTAYVRGVALLAEVMQRRPQAFAGYYHWQVYYLTERGDVLLPVGYDEQREVPVGRYLTAHPQR